MATAHVRAGDPEGARATSGAQCDLAASGKGATWGTMRPCRASIILMWCAAFAPCTEGGSHIRRQVSTHTLGVGHSGGWARGRGADGARHHLGGLFPPAAAFSQPLLRLRGGGLLAGLRKDVPRGGTLWGLPKEDPPVAEGPVKTGDEAYYKQGDRRVVHHNNQYSQMIERRDLMAIESGKLVIVMVGLPGRGKSYISRRLELFMSWLGDNVKVFNVGKYRRKIEDPNTGTSKADFFDPNNAEAAGIRERAASLAMKDMLDFLDGPGQVAIFDATNSQKKRRQWLRSTIKAHNVRHQVVFVESICEDPKILEENMRSKIANSPDYGGMSPEEALADLRKRIQNYESAYQPVNSIGLSYIKLFDLSSRVMVNKIYGRLATGLVPYLMSVHIGTRPIWLVRAGTNSRI
jgi:predicted kinase